MPFLQSAELRSEVHVYLTGTLRGLECDPLQVGGVEDHVHILCGLIQVSLRPFRAEPFIGRKRQSNTPSRRGALML